MLNIEQILSEIEGITDDQRKAIISGVNENYRTKAETDSKAQRISALEKEVEEYKQSVEKLQGESQEIENLKQQIADFEAADEKRKNDEIEADKAASFAKTFDDAVASRKDGTGTAFANDLMRESVLAKVREMCEGDTTIGVSEAIESVTKNVAGVWANPQKREPAKMPTSVENKDDKQKAAMNTIHQFMAGVSGLDE